MAKKIFIGNISWNVRDQDLQEAFSRFGKLAEAKVIVDPHTHRSRGFGFVSFEDNNDAGAQAFTQNPTQFPMTVGGQYALKRVKRWKDLESVSI